MSRSILITGGSGFIGLQLAKRLAAEGSDSITLADNFQRGRMDGEFATVAALPNVHILEGDLRDPAVRGKLGSGYDEVYHLAAMLGVENVLRRPVDVLRVNALLTAEILEWFVAGGGKKFMFSSTSEAYAWTQQFHELPIPTPEDVPLALTDLSNPRSTYAGSKIFGELFVTQYCEKAGLPFVITRYHNVYGPRMGYDHVIPQIFERVTSGENPLAVYSAHHVRAFCYVDDAVSATITAMRTPAAENGTFNIGNDDEQVTIENLAARILQKAESAATMLPQVAANDPIARRCPDMTKARKVLGYKPLIPLDEGLNRTLAWYRANPRPKATP